MSLSKIILNKVKCLGLSLHYRDGVELVDGKPMHKKGNEYYPVTHADFTEGFIYLRYDGANTRYEQGQTACKKIKIETVTYQLVGVTPCDVFPCADRETIELLLCDALESDKEMAKQIGAKRIETRITTNRQDITELDDLLRDCDANLIRFKIQASYTIRYNKCEEPLEVCGRFAFSGAEICDDNVSEPECTFEKL